MGFPCRLWYKTIGLSLAAGPKLLISNRRKKTLPSLCARRIFQSNITIRSCVERTITSSESNACGMKIDVLYELTQCSRKPIQSFLGISFAYMQLRQTVKRIKKNAFLLPHWISMCECVHGVWTTYHNQLESFRRQWSYVFSVLAMPTSGVGVQQHKISTLDVFNLRMCFDCIVQSTAIYRKFRSFQSIWTPSWRKKKTHTSCTFFICIPYHAFIVRV